MLFFTHLIKFKIV